MLNHCPCFPSLFRRHADHFMGHCFGKHNYDIGLSYLTFKICRTLGKNFALTSMPFANFFITAMHPIMSAYDNHTHEFHLPRHLKLVDAAIAAGSFWPP